MKLNTKPLRQPVVYAALIRLALYAAVAFGLTVPEVALHATDAQIMGAVVAVTEGATALVVRSRVSPVKSEAERVADALRSPVPNEHTDAPTMAADGFPA